MKIILIILGLLGVSFGLLSYYQNKHIPQNNKKSLILTLVAIVILIIGLIIK